MSIWIAKLLGPVLVALAIPMMFNPKATDALTKDFLADKPLILISGVLAMLGGLAIINTHNIWVWQWISIITFFGWALAIGGAVRIMFPQMAAKIGGKMINQANKLTAPMGIAWALLGIFLSYKAYF